jgi:hypothetical protein
MAQSYPDSVTINIWPYYKFIQYYPYSRLTLTFGESEVFKTNGDHYFMGLSNWDPDVNRPLYVEPSSLYLYSGTRSQDISAGDTLLYYWSLDAERDVDTTVGTIYGITDTLIFYLEVIDNDNASSWVIDTLGLAPCDSVHEYHQALIPQWRFTNPDPSYNDTAIIKRYIFPQAPGGANDYNFKLRIRHEFKGPDSSYKLVRWDDYTQHVKLSVYAQERSTAILALAMNFLDSLYGKMSTSANSSNKNEIGMILTPSTTSTYTTINLSQTVHPQYALKIYNSIGHEVMNRIIPENSATYPLKVHTLPPGYYYLTLSTGTQIHAISKLVVSE